VQAGLVTCVYCGEQIVGAFDLAHSDDRRSYIGAACPSCNRREAGLKSVRLGYGKWQRRAKRSCRDHVIRIHGHGKPTTFA
jgi:hypothetical protein